MTTYNTIVYSRHTHHKRKYTKDGAPCSASQQRRSRFALYVAPQDGSKVGIKMRRVCQEFTNRHQAALLVGCSELPAEPM